LIQKESASQKLEVGLAFGAAPAVVAKPQRSARTVNGDIVGSWCLISQDKIEHRYLIDEERNCNAAEPLTIGPSHYIRYEEEICHFTAVKTWFDPNIVAATKTMGVNVSRINSTCGGEGCTWKEQVIAYVTKGTLVVKYERHSQERCRG
jgi:hypothetical protein